MGAAAMASPLVWSAIIGAGASLASGALSGSDQELGRLGNPDADLQNWRSKNDWMFEKILNEGNNISMENTLPDAVIPRGPTFAGGGLPTSIGLTGLLGGGNSGTGGKGPVAIPPPHRPGPGEPGGTPGQPGTQGPNSPGFPNPPPGPSEPGGPGNGGHNPLPAGLPGPQLPPEGPDGGDNQNPSLSMSGPGDVRRINLDAPGAGDQNIQNALIALKLLQGRR